MYQGNEIGTFQQTSVDVPQTGQTILGSAYQTAAGPVNFFGAVTMGFLVFSAPVVLEASLALPETGGLGLRALEGRAGQEASTGRNVPANLKEQLAMQQAKSNPRAGQRVPITRTHAGLQAKAG